ncbi:MAG: hypothetical protein WB973_15020 [Thermoanaerobaculia bacterium]
MASFSPCHFHKCRRDPNIRTFPPSHFLAEQIDHEGFDEKPFALDTSASFSRITVFGRFSRGTPYLAALRLLVELHTEAAAAYRKLCRKLADDPTHRAYFALQSARASVGAGDLTAARDDADAADGFIQQARGRSKDPSEARTYLQLSDDIKRFRDRNKLH